MADFTLSKANISFGIRTILDDMSFSINEGDKIGLVGANGVGKTSLVRLLIGEIEASSGQVFSRSGLRIAYLKQNVHIESDKNLYQYCLGKFYRIFDIEKELENIEKNMGRPDITKDQLTELLDRHDKLSRDFVEEGGLNYENLIKSSLKGFNFRPEQLDEPVNKLSGGEKARLELAMLFFGRPDVLILDEPTNHLDIAGVRFLEKSLAAFQRTIIAISHDRYFLDSFVNRILYIEDCKIKSYKSNYHDFSLQRAKERVWEERAFAKQEAEIARQEEIISRLSKLGGSRRKRGISQSRSRQRLLDKMKRLEKPAAELEHMKFSLSPKYQSGQDVLHIEGLAKSYARPLFTDLDLDIKRGQKVALIGANGTGKTTLFRIIRRLEKADSGRANLGSAVKLAYFDQEQKDLTDDKTVLDELWDAYPLMDHYQIRANLARFQFVGDDIFKYMGDLSGGERARLSLLKLMLSDANFLLLDEPTNHLDMESREILEDALIDYEGTIFVISHDRYFINKVCKRIFALEEGEIQVYEGDYDYYISTIEKSENKDQTEVRNKTQEKKDRKLIKLENKARADKKKQADSLLNEIKKKEKLLKDIELELADHSNYNDYEKIAEMDMKRRELETTIDDLSADWLILAEELEEKEN